MKQYIYIVQGYTPIEGSDDLSDVCTFELQEESAEAAIATATMLVTKEAYRINRVIEKIETHA